MKSKDKKKNKGSSSSTKASSKETAKVSSNPRLVAALRSSDEAKMVFKTSLITIATIVQEEQLTRAEVVASLMEARSIEKTSADSEYSRMKGLLNNPEIMEQLKSGEIDLKTARMATKKTQKNPNTEKKKENIQKRFSGAITSLTNAAKEGGMDKASVLIAVKQACKKAGIV